MKHLFLSLLIIILPCLLSASTATHSVNTSQETSLFTTSDCIQETISSSVDISWPSLYGATAYSVIVIENGTTIMQTTVIGTSYKITGLVSGHHYSYRVAGIFNGNQSADYIIFDDTNP